MPSVCHLLGQLLQRSGRAHTSGTKLLRLRVPFFLGARLFFFFSSLSIPQWRVLNQISRGDATLLIFLDGKNGCEALLLGTNMHRFGTQICDLLFTLEESYLADNYRDYRIKVQGSPSKSSNHHYFGLEEWAVSYVFIHFVMKL